MTKKILAVAALATLSCLSLAQGMRGGMGGMMRMMRTGPIQSLMMVRRDDVQAELKLSDDQKGKLDALNAGMQSRFMAAFSDLRNSGIDMSDREAMMKAIGPKMQALTETMSKEALVILDEDQRKRVQELVVQSQGSLAVLTPEIAKEIALTPAQKAKIDDLQRLQDEANAALMQKARDGEMPWTEMGEAMAKNTKIMDDSVAKALTEPQRAKLKAMSGKPFEFKDPKPGTPGSMGFGRPGGG